MPDPRTLIVPVVFWSLVLSLCIGNGCVSAHVKYDPVTKAVDARYFRMGDQQVSLEAGDIKFTQASQAQALSDLAGALGKLADRLPIPTP